MPVVNALLSPARRALRLVLRRMGPDVRQRIVVGALRNAVAVSDPVQRGALFRLVARESLAWPVIDKADELHTAGLYAAVRETAAVRGEVVECGVGHGRSLVTFARAVEEFCPEKKVIGFDSFAGFPPASKHDVGKRVKTAGTAPTGWTDTSPELIRALLDAPAEVVPGFFEASLPGALPEHICLLHVDCDLYDSTKVVLKFCLPRVPTGGLVILDEYKDQLERWPGASRAVDEELSGTGLTPVWEPTLQRFIVRV